MRRCRLRRVWEVNGFHLESCREVRIASTGGAYGWLSNFEAHGLRLVCNSLPRSFLFTMEFSDGIGMRGISRVQGRKYVCCMEYGRRFGHSFRTSSTNVARLFVYLSLSSIFVFTHKKQIPVLKHIISTFGILKNIPFFSCTFP